MYYVNDYPDWVDELVNHLGIDDSSFEEEVWNIVRESEEPPHIGNVQVSWLFERIIEEIKKGSPSAECKYEANGRGSYLTVDGEDITDIDQLKEIE